MTIEFTPGFFTLRLGETSLNLWDPKLRPTLGCTLSILQTCGSLSDDP
jgi:hypothetical protein